MERLHNQEPNYEQEKFQEFDEIFEAAMNSEDGFIEYTSMYPKEEFLKYLVENKGVLLHGSNNTEINELEPRQANCASKEFGNQKGVYACKDEVLPMFYAIKDKEKFNGTAESGYSLIGENPEEAEKHYHFAVPQKMLDIVAWSDGVIYVLSQDGFRQGHDDDGKEMDEWMSLIEVEPLAKLRISPGEFPYFDEIQARDGS